MPQGKVSARRVELMFEVDCHLQIIKAGGS